MAVGLSESILSVAKEYVRVLRENDISFESAWVFGSALGEGFDDDSDIDVAIVMGGTFVKFFKELELAKYRRPVDLRIEVHVLPLTQIDSPFARAVLEEGIRIA